MCYTVGYKMNTLYFSWLDSPITIDAEASFQGLRVEDPELYDCSQNYTTGIFLHAFSL